MALFSVGSLVGTDPPGKAEVRQGDEPTWSRESWWPWVLVCPGTGLVTCGGRGPYCTNVRST